MGKFKTGVQTFLHKHSMPIIAVLLVVAAIVAGTVQVKISDINAASDVGHAGGASDVNYPKGKVKKFAQGPEIAVTPKVYDYGSLVENATGSFGKKGSRAIKKYSEKVAAVANNKSKLIKSGDGWDVHSDPSNLYNSIITISNAQRRDMVSTTISNRADHYTDGSMIFIPKSTVNKQYGDIHAYSHTVVGYKLNDKGDTKGSHTKSQLIFDGSDNGLSSFFDGVSVKGNSDSQRTYNKSILQDKVIGSNSNGIFMSKIREMEKNNKSAGKNNPQLSYTGKDGKIHKYEYQASDMLYISQHLTELLKYAQQNDSAYSKSLKLFALATNVYESGGNLYTCPKTLQDYVSIVTKNSIKNYKDKTDDLNRIMKDDTKHLMQTTLEGEDDPDGSDVGTREYEMYKEILKDGDISGNLFGNQTSKTDSIVAQYIQGEYNMSYLDMLLCGYSIACHREDNSSAAAHAWKRAITAFVDSVNDKSGKNNSVGAQGKVVMIRFDLGLMSKTGSMAFHHTSNGSMAMNVFGLGDGADIDTKNKTLNSKTMIKSFIGIQTKGHTDSKLVFNGNNYITTYRKAMGSNLNSYYKRLGTAAKKAHPKTKDMYTNFSSYSLGTVNRLYNMSEIGAKASDSTAPGKAGSEDYIELLKNGLTDKDGGMFNLKKSYNYGTYATVAMSWWDTKPETTNPPGYELRIYSTKAHAEKQGEDLEDNKNPNTGKLTKNGKEANGNQIHSTAETVKITATQAGPLTLTDDISLKIDVPAKTKSDDNAINFAKLVNSEDANVEVEYSASADNKDTKLNTKELAKTDPNGNTMGLVSTRDYTSDKGYQDEKQIDCINDDGKNGKYSYVPINIVKSDPDATGVKVLNNAEKYEPPASINANKKEIISDRKSTCYSDYYASTEQKSDWKDMKYTKNLVWQTGFNEMEKDGFEINVPDVKEGETWVHYYRVCVVAKITITNKKTNEYFYTKKDSSGKKVPDKEKSVNYTNPVYITYKVTYKPSSTPKFEFYGDMGSIDNSDSVKAHAYSEFKEGSVYNETFEAMAGVPSTRTMYFATGGEEFMVNLQAVYDDYVAKKGSTVGEEGENVDPNAYKAVRKYTVHFNGVDCEYKEGDTFKSGQGPRNTKQETFVADSNDKKEKKQVNAQINNCYSIPGGGTGNVTTKDHGTTTEIYAEWTGTIGNTSKLNKSGANKNPTGKPCESGDAGDFYTCSPTTGWNTTAYNEAVKNARDWATKMSGTSEGGTILRKDDSDGYERIYHCGEAKVVITLSGGGDGGKDLHTGARTISDSREFDKSVSGGEIAMNSSSLGSGWSWHKGKKATPTGECKDTFDSKGNVTGHVHQSWTGYEASSDSKASDVSFTIKVTFPKAYIDAKNFDGNSSNVTLSKIDAGNGIPAHAMCGACCQHVLPAIEDTWTQKVRYDTVRFSALQVWKLDDGYAGDVSSSQSSSDTDEDDSGDEEDEGETDTSDGGSGDTDSEMYTLKHKTDGNGTGAESYGSGTAAGVDSDTSIPGNGDGSVRPITGNESEYVRSKIVRYDPNIFYNIATSETSKAGRLRYSLQRGQDDDVYYEEMGDPQRSGGQTRDNLCDGQTSSWGSSPVTVNATGHKKSFCKGCLYSNDTYSNDMHHNDNPKKSTTKYANWSDDIDPNKTTVGPVAETKTTYTNNTADAIDKESTEWKRFEARRAQPNEVKVISDFLILQTSSGDQSMFYYDNDGKTLKTTRCDENFPDDFWYSKPASSDYIKKSGGGRWYVENTPAAQSAWAEMWDNNPLRFDCNTMQVNMGGYNGQYANVDTKYNGTGHDEVVKTDFDDDYEYFNGASNDDMKSGNSHGAKANASGFKSRDGRDCPAAEIYNSSSKAAHSRNIESKSKQSADQRATCNSDSDVMYGYDDGYISSPGCGNVGESGNSLDTGLEGSARAEHNTYDFYKAPTKQSAWGSYIYGHNENGQTVRWNNRIPDPGVAKFGSARFVLLQDGISLNPTIKNTLYNTGLSFAFYKPILRYQNKAADSSDMIKSYYGTQNHTGENYNIVELHEAVNDYEFHIKNETDPYLNKAGVTYASAYTDGQTKVNNIIIHDPVSVQYSKVIGADKSYDQRIYGDDKSSAKTASEEESDSETCPGTAEDCIFRVLNCKYAQRIRRAAFDIDHATRQLYDPEDDDSGTYDTIESTVMSDKTYPSIDLTGSGFTLAMDNGSTYTGDEAEDEDGNVTSYTAKHLKGSRGASLEFQWAAFGVDTTRKSERYEVGGDFTFDGTGQEALFATDGTKVTRLSNGKIQIETDDGTYTSAETVGSGKHEILYRFAFDSVLFKDVTIKVGGKTYKLEANTGVKVDGKDLTFTGPEQKGTNYYVSNAGSGFYIGNAPGKELDASYSIDNIRVDRLAGSASHTAGCFTIGQEVHEKTRQNYYNGTGKLSTGKIDWTSEYDDGSMSRVSINNKHTHTGKCLSSVSEGLKIAIQEASAGNTTDLRKELGEKVWNKVKDKLSECYGDDGSTVAVGQTTTYGYTGGTQKVTLVPGTYQLEAYGAKGGNDSQAGGNGGYAKGKLKVDKATDIYIAAGGKGADAATGNGGGYNGGDCRAADGGGGGGGFYGGYGAQEDAGAGGGSGYTSPRLTETTMSNGVNSGNGYAKIKVLELKTYSPKKVLNVIKNVIGGDVSQIPSYVTTDGHTIVNPIWVCEGKYDEHVCTDNCKTLKNGKVDVALDCSEPHHTGEHYDAGDPICYDPCNDDAKHKAAAEGKVKYDRDGKPTSDNGTDDDSRFIRLDNYFTVYYPCLGDFADTNDHGIAWCEQSRGMGYVNSMDCVEWTREKWIRFPYSTLYYRESIGKWEEHPADEWYQVDVGYEDSAGNYHPYNYYKFYCQLRNKEISMGKVEFMVEAINDAGSQDSPYGYETPYGRDDIFAQDCPEDNTWNTNKDRFSGADGPDAVSPTYTAYHSVYKNYLIDVVGRIGNLLFEDSTDWRFSNFFKQASTPLKWNQDGIAYEVNKAKQNMYYSWHLNNDDTAEDIRTQKVTPNIQWYNTYSTLKWTDVGNAMYKAAPTPLEAWKNYTHQDQYFQETYGKDVSTYLEQTHMQFGYDLLWDISTIGNYHEGNLQIEPKYYAFDTWTKKVIPVDVHMSDGEDTKTINYFGLMDEYGTKRYDEYSAKLYHYNMNLDWKHERKERNATGDEWANTLKVSEAYVNYLYDGDGNLITGSDSETLTVNLDIPHGENYSIGDIQFQYLNRGRTATFFGSSRVPALNSGTYDNTDKYTKTLNNGINGDIDEELWHEYGVLGAEGGKNDVKDTEYMLNGQRWHTRLGLPSNVRFTSASDKNGDGLPDHVSPDALTTDENGNTIREWEKFDNNEIEKKTGRRRYVILETATITAIGDPWDLRYDQKENNGHITVGSKYTGGETYTYYFEQTHDEKNSIWDFPTLLAVYDNDIPTDSDYDTLQTH